MKHFDEMGLLHEKAGCEGWILHETADSGLEGVLDGPVRALGRVEGSGRGKGLPCGGRVSRAPETAPCRLPCQFSFKSCLVGAGLALETMQ